MDMQLSISVAILCLGVSTCNCRYWCWALWYKSQGKGMHQQVRKERENANWNVVICALICDACASVYICVCVYLLYTAVIIICRRGITDSRPRQHCHCHRDRCRSAVKKDVSQNKDQLIQDTSCHSKIVTIYTHLRFVFHVIVHHFANQYSGRGWRVQYNRTVACYAYSARRTLYIY